MRRIVIDDIFTDLVMVLDLRVFRRLTLIVPRSSFDEL